MEEEDKKLPFPWDDAWQKGMKLDVYLIANVDNSGESVLTKLSDDGNDGNPYVLLEESATGFDVDSMCNMENKIPMDDKDDGSLSGLATAASALFLAVASIAF